MIRYFILLLCIYIYFNLWTVSFIKYINLIQTDTYSYYINRIYNIIRKQYIHKIFVGTLVICTHSINKKVPRGIQFKLGLL